jgi:hypothetical protein
MLWRRRTEQQNPKWVIVLIHLRRSTFGFLVGVKNPLNFFFGLLTTETGGLWLPTA